MRVAYAVALEVIKLKEFRYARKKSGPQMYLVASVERNLTTTVIIASALQNGSHR